MNEGDHNEPDWQQKFFGTQDIYSRLKSIKRTVDPDGLFICKIELEVMNRTILLVLMIEIFLFVF